MPNKALFFIKIVDLPIPETKPNLLIPANQNGIDIAISKGFAANTAIVKGKNMIIFMIVKSDIVSCRDPYITIFFTIKSADRIRIQIFWSGFILMNKAYFSAFSVKR